MEYTGQYMLVGEYEVDGGDDFIEIPPGSDGTLPAAASSVHVPGDTALEFLPDSYSSYETPRLFDGEFRALGGSRSVHQLDCDRPIGMWLINT